MAEKRHVRGACPMDCPDTCSWIVTVEDGRAVKLQGDRAHPFTRGALCNKLNDYIAYTQSPDRLLYPMRRVGPKGGGRFARISWDEALAEISARLLEISEEFGAEAIWPYVGSGNMGLIQGIYGAGWRFATHHERLHYRRRVRHRVHPRRQPSRHGSGNAAVFKIDYLVGRQHPFDKRSSLALHLDSASKRRLPCGD